MLCFHCSVPVDLHMNMSSFKQINRSNKVFKKTPISACDQSRLALIDLVLLIIVLGACGFLIYPYISLVFFESVEILEPIMCVVEQQVLNAPMIYGCFGVTIFVASMGVLVVMFIANRKCGRSDCRGLHKAAEFDIQLETEDCVKNSNLNSNLRNMGSKYVLKKGLFELPRDYHKELEAELKKMAPPKGRAVLVFRARCGCSISRMEVPGSK